MCQALKREEVRHQGFSAEEANDVMDSPEEGNAPVEIGLLPPSMNRCRDPRIDPVGEQILDLLKSTAHDLRSAMVGVGAGLKLVTRGYFGPMDRETGAQVEKINKQVCSLMGMLEDALGRAFALSNGIFALPEQLNLREDVLDPVISELSNEMEHRCDVFDNALDSAPREMLVLRGDRFWLKTIFRNLMRNALKHGGPGVKLSIGFRWLKDFVVVNVYNSGRPVPERLRPFLFEGFGWCGSGERGKQDGLGLGLYLVKQAVERHGGEIWYEAGEDGSNFVFTLPGGSDER